MNIIQIYKMISRINRILKSQPKVMNQHFLKRIVEKYFEDKQKYLSTLSTASSPCYLFDKQELLNKADSFQNAFKKHFDNIDFYYAVKSNSYLEISSILLNKGFGLDVSSGLELESALNLNAGKIIFSGPGKTDSELSLAIKHSEKVVIWADSINELNRINKIASISKSIIKTGLRVHTNEEGLWKKFGIPIKEMLDRWEEIKKLDNIVFQGLQFHSSWNLNPSKQVTIIKDIGGMLKFFPESLLNSLKILDIGGGYWPSTGEWIQYSNTPVGNLKKSLNMPVSNDKTKYFHIPSEPITTFAYELAESIKTSIFPYFKPKIILEPGRWICNNAMHILLTVVDKKSTDTVITDGGTNLIGWERFEYDYFPILNLSKPELKERNCNIYGSLCTPHDIWGYSYWGENISIGDILMVPMQGAYTYSLRQQFIKPVSEVLTI